MASLIVTSIGIILQLITLWVCYKLYAKACEIPQNHGEKPKNQIIPKVFTRKSELTPVRVSEEMALEMEKDERPRFY